jgi:hypothetical protein
MLIAFPFGVRQLSGMMLRAVGQLRSLDDFRKRPSERRLYLGSCRRASSLNSAIAVTRAPLTKEEVRPRLALRYTVFVVFVPDQYRSG